MSPSPVPPQNAGLAVSLAQTVFYRPHNSTPVRCSCAPTAASHACSSPRSIPVHAAPPSGLPTYPGTTYGRLRAFDAAPTMY
jgi:hypothetical protein